MTRPFSLFGGIAAILFLIGVCPVVRFLYFYWQGQGDGNIQSLVIAGIVLAFSGMSMMLGMLAELSYVNRMLMYKTLRSVRGIENGKHDSK